MTDRSAKPLVITSINPNGRVAYQLKCFRQWQQAGFQVLTLNVEDEAKRLEKAGIDKSEICVINATATGQQLFGRPVPRVKAAFDVMRAHPEAGHFILANADLYPAIRSATIVNLWEGVADCVAMTREETHSLEAHAYTDKAPYRGGLDAFFMTRNGLGRVFRTIITLKASERMCFGIPGWDFLLGAITLSPDVGGSILDGDVLLHEAHKTTYEGIDEFSNYVDDMKKLKAVTSDDALQGAMEFAASIERNCEKNARFSLAARRMFYTPSGGLVGERHAYAARSIRRNLFSLAPAIAPNYRMNSIAALLQSAERDDFSFEAAKAAFVTSPSNHVRFLQVLLAIVFCMRCERAGRRKIAVTSAAGRAHRLMLQHIVRDRSEPSGMRRLAIAELFGADVINGGVFSPLLFKYLCLSCGNDTERRLIREIGNQVKLERRNADQTN